MNYNKYSKTVLILFIVILVAFSYTSGFQDNLKSSIVKSKFDKNLKISKSEYNDTSTINKIYSIPELHVKPSPNTVQQITFSESERIIDYDVSPKGIVVAALIKNNSSQYWIKFWEIGNKEISEKFQIPAGLKTNSIAWHPRGNSVFIMGKMMSKYQIYKVVKKNNKWTSLRIFSTPTKLRRLVFCPRPFYTTDDFLEYRIFFGMDNGDKSYRIVSITENGKKLYQVVGPQKTISYFENSGVEPSSMVASWALPLTFHPAGHQLIWQDNKHNFYVAKYNSKFWGNYKKMKINIEKKGTITPTPNGLGFIHWQKGKRGIGVYLLSTIREEMQISDYLFISTPSSVPDGKGIVGLTSSNTDYCCSLSKQPQQYLLEIHHNQLFFQTPKK